MRTFLLTAAFLVLLGACASSGRSPGEAYRWVSFEDIPKTDHGKVIGKPVWGPALRIKSHAADTFVVYGKNDSILMHTPDGEPQMFRKINIPSSKWKAKPEYGKKLYFMGNYVTKDLEGLYASYYCTRDRGTIMQVYYTNPGNMNTVILFAKDSVNILKESGIIIDPREEVSEPERPVPLGH